MGCALVASPIGEVGRGPYITSTSAITVILLKAPSSISFPVREGAVLQYKAKQYIYHINLEYN